MSYSYIASPYSHKDEAVREGRYQAVLEFTATMLKAGEHVYSPIVHCHHMAIAHGLPAEFAFWEAYDKAMISKAKGLIVLMLDGWKESRGVAAEITYAQRRGIPIRFVKADQRHKPMPRDTTRLRKYDVRL